MLVTIIPQSHITNRNSLPVSYDVWKEELYPALVGSKGENPKPLGWVVSFKLVRPAEQSPRITRTGVVAAHVGWRFGLAGLSILASRLPA